VLDVPREWKGAPCVSKDGPKKPEKKRILVDMAANSETYPVTPGYDMASAKGPIQERQLVNFNADGSVSVDTNLTTLSLLDRDIVNLQQQVTTLVDLTAHMAKEIAHLKKILRREAVWSLDTNL